MRRIYIMNCKTMLNALVLLLFIGFGIGTSQAAEGFKVAHKVVFHVDTADIKEQHIALNNAANLLKHYGTDNVKIEVIAYGPGLVMLTNKSDSKERVHSLAQQNIRFSACANTMKGIKRKTGKVPVLTDGVKIVSAGVARIIELEEQGYSYIRP